MDKFIIKKKSGVKIKRRVIEEEGNSGIYRWSLCK